MDYTQITLLNMLDELGPLAQGAGWQRVDSCSDVLVQLPSGQVLLGHNEDADANDLNNTYVSSVTSSTGASFSAYTYPGQLPGGAFGFNSAGVFFSTNAVFPKDISLAGVPRNFLQRHLLDSSSVQDALTKGECRGGTPGCTATVLSCALVTRGAAPSLPACAVTSHDERCRLWLFAEHRQLHGGQPTVQRRAAFKRSRVRVEQ